MKNFLAFLLTCSCFCAFAQKKIAEPVTILPGHSNDVDAVSVSTQGYIATGSWDKHVNVYKADSPYTLFKTLGGHAGPVNIVKFSPNGKILATASEELLIQLWDSTFKNIKRFESHKDKINCLSFDPMNRYLYSGSDDKTMIVWDIAKGTQVKTVSNGQPVYSIAMTSDLRFIYIAGAEPKIKMYSMITNKVAKTFDGHTDIVNSLAISRNGNYMLSGSNDKTARIWDLRTGKQVRILPVDCWKVTVVAFSDDSKYAITGCNDGSVKIWETESGKLISSIDGKGSIVRGLAFMRNLRLVAVAYMLKGDTNYGLRLFETGIEPAPASSAASPAPAATPKKVPAKPTAAPTSPKK